MKLYDTVIQSIYELLNEKMEQNKQLYSENSIKICRCPDEKAVGEDNDCENEIWQDAGEYNMILPSEMAYELGGGTHRAVSGLGFTSDMGLVEKDEILLYGPDLPDIQKDISYARLTMIRLGEDFLKEKGSEDEAYQMLRKIDYTRYHINPYGYMMRISSAEDREPVRIGREALAKGMNFEKIGKLFQKEYHKNPEVLAVKLIFITTENFLYDSLNPLVKKLGKITESLNHVLSNIQMNCSVCGLREICEEVEELKELHFRRTDISDRITS